MITVTAAPNFILFFLNESLGPEAVSQCSPNIQEALGSTPSTEQEGAHLRSQHLGGGSSRTRSSRSFEVWEESGHLRPRLKKKCLKTDFSHKIL